MIVVTAIVAAVMPTVVYGLLLWWLDRYEKEPLQLLVVAFCWGAAPAIILAVLFELILAVPLERSPLGPNAANWGLAPIIEELLKALALVGLFRWARSEFDGALDGIVYGALVGFGFSMTENALYFLSTPDLGGSFWLRGVLFGTNHAFFTSLTGLSLGIVRYEQNRWRRWAALVSGLALAVLFHAIHNILVGSMRATGLVVSWLVQSSGVLVVLSVAALAWRYERSVMEQELGDEVRAGVLTVTEYAEVISSLRRVRGQIRALGSRGWSCFQRVRRLHHLATELAFCKAQVRLRDQFRNGQEIERLREEILALRTELGDVGEVA